MKLEAQSKTSREGEPLPPIEMYSTSWLTANAITAAAQYKSKLMHQTSLSIREGWKKLLFIYGSHVHYINSSHSSNLS